MTIEIPTWLLWTLLLGMGVPATVIVVLLAMLGWAFLRPFNW